MLSAIEAKIKDIKRRKCQEDNKNDYNACPWNGDVSNKYLPTQAELYKEIIYLNQGSVKIESLKDDIEYTVSGSL